MDVHRLRHSQTFAICQREGAPGFFKLIKSHVAECDSSLTMTDILDSPSSYDENMTQFFEGLWSSPHLEDSPFDESASIAEEAEISAPLDTFLTHTSLTPHSPNSVSHPHNLQNPTHRISPSSTTNLHSYSSASNVLSIPNLLSQSRRTTRPSPAVISSSPSQASTSSMASGDSSDSSTVESRTPQPESSRPRRTQHTNTGPRPSSSRQYIDLTNDIPSKHDTATLEERSRKRRRLPHRKSSSQNSLRSKRIVQTHSVKVEEQSAIPAVEEVDLRDVDDDKALSRVLEEQRQATIRAQQAQAAIPIKLGSLQCIICMDAMSDVTATFCGKYSFQGTLYDWQHLL